MSIERKFKMALDETRLLMLGSQILFGFQLQSVFQEGFRDLPKASQSIDAAALLLMAITIALLIAPAAEHRIAEAGQITGRLRNATTLYAGLALLPFALSLGLDLYVALSRAFGSSVGISAGIFFASAALLFWYVLEFGYRHFLLHKGEQMDEKGEAHPTKLQVRIDQLLTEARIVIPGAQALLGFQLVVALNRTFSELPESSKIVHALALGCVAMTLVLLVAPAAFHRIAFRGADDLSFYRIASNLVSAALLPLALGISGDVYVAIGKIAHSGGLAAAAAGFVLILFLGFWYALPLVLRGLGRKSGK